MSISYDHINATSLSRQNSPQYGLCIAIALLAIILINSGDISLLVQAVEPPSVPSTLEIGVSTPVKNSNENHIASTDNDISNDNNEEKDIVVGDQRVEEKIIETIQSSDEKVFVEGDKIDVQDDTDNYVNTLLPEPKAKDGDNIDNLNIHDSKAQKDGGRRQRRMQRQNRDKEQKHRTDVIDSVDEVQQPLQAKSIQADYDAYMSWCAKVLGIKSVVEIQEFEYIDHLQIYWDENDIDDRLDKFDWLEEYTTATQTNDEIGNNEELPTKLVRGLAAKHDIQVGDVVISIPLFSLLSIPTTIDHDPVLSRILGPEARIQYGFTDASEYELPLLVLAVLYHRSLGDDSPISHYIDILLETSTDSFPFLWSDKELREMTDDRGEVKKLARGIRQDLHVLYNDVMGTLVRENKEWFGPPDGYSPHQSEVNAVDWIYSYENFQWAFALVISRHHYLPISAFDDEDSIKSIKRPPTPKLADYPSIMHETLSSANEVVPPANQPTDSWVDEAHNEERVVEDDIIVPTDDDLTSQSSSSPVKHSFLAPLADLINFGPPCLIGSYNEEEVSAMFVCVCISAILYFNLTHLPLFSSMHLN